MAGSFLLLADSTNVGGAFAAFEWGRIQSEWDYLPPLAVFALAATYALWMYRRDTREHAALTRNVLLGLRLAALAGLLLIYLQPQWRNEIDTVTPSRVEILSDTSLSMATVDGDASRVPAEPSRGLQVASALTDGNIIARLRLRHDVHLWRFDQEVAPVAAYSHQASAARASQAASHVTEPQPRLRLLLWAVAALALAFVVAGIAYVVLNEYGWSRSKLAGFMALVTGVLALSGACALVWSASARDLAGWLSIIRPSVLPSSDGPKPLSEPQVDLASALAPQGAETRLGQALQHVLNEARGMPLAGILLFSDGQHNTGLSPRDVIDQLREARVPIYAVGVGSDRDPQNVRITDLVAPQRAFPGDKYTVTGFVQGLGFAGQTVRVELRSKAATGIADPTAGQLEGTQTVTLGPEGEVTAVRFEVTPQEVGRRALSLAVTPPSADTNPADNTAETDVEVVDRQTRVLLFAGGPTREYQFLRNQLRRDQEVIVDVLLQTGSEGVSQDANQILASFPASREQQFAYDCIVAFDPDWTALSAAQIELVEQWVGDQAGGMIVVPGPIYADGWAQEDALVKIRALYPVEFHRRFASLADARYGSEEPWPIEFTREGREAEFLFLEDSAAASFQAWNEFEGVYGYYDVKGPKLGATVYGRYSNPSAGSGESKPVYMAGQFYGSGRVFYLASGEMWRLRAYNPTWFERLYTRLVRHVSQGRLLRGSTRGLLLVERDRYLLGNTVDVRATLQDERLEPLTAASVNLEVLHPDTTVQAVLLRADPSRAGSFRGQFTVRKEGAYRLELPLPGSESERLSKRIAVRVSDAERERVTRNDALLAELAERTGGAYFRGLEALADAPAESGLDTIPDRSRTITLPSQPDRLWDNGWILGLVVGCLCVEWLIRRLVKLA